jgi:hypothetical protein
MFIQIKPVSLAEVDQLVEVNAFSIDGPIGMFRNPIFGVNSMAITLTCHAPDILDL